MPNPTEKTLRQLFALSGNRCAFLDCSAVIFDPSGAAIGQIAHIRARSPGGPRHDSAMPVKDLHSLGNLILLCANHHRLVDANPGIYPSYMLSQMKAAHEAKFARTDQELDATVAKVLLRQYKVESGISVKGNSGPVAINSPNSIQGNVINLNSRRQQVVVSPPPDTIGSDPSKARYVSHLITRYNDFASKEPSRSTEFKYGVLSKNIESKFGGPWKLLDVDRFEEVCQYLHGRIQRTRFAKNNAAKGYPSYSSYEQFRTKHGK